MLCLDLPVVVKVPVILRKNHRQLFLQFMNTSNFSNSTVCNSKSWTNSKYERYLISLGM